MALIDDINSAIQDEILNDPQGIGYSGKTDDEITILLNSPVINERVVYDTSPSPINRILRGIASAPNIVQVIDVSNIQQSIALSSKAIGA